MGSSPRPSQLLFGFTGRPSSTYTSGPGGLTGLYRPQRGRSCDLLTASADHTGSSRRQSLSPPLPRLKVPSLAQYLLCTCLLDE